MRRFTTIARDLLLTAAILSILGLVVVKLDERQEAALSGMVRVIDGDTLTMGRDRVRLAGIDAPELRQTCRRDDLPFACGEEARTRLAGLIGQTQVQCMVGGSDRYRRLLAVCSAGGQDLNAAMVASGYAVAFGDYAAQEQAARDGRLGLWAGTFDPPRVWRQTHGVMDEAPHGIGDWLALRVLRLEERALSLWKGIVDG